MLDCIVNVRAATAGSILFMARASLQAYNRKSKYLCSLHQFRLRAVSFMLMAICSLLLHELFFKAHIDWNLLSREPKDFSSSILHEPQIRIVFGCRLLYSINIHQSMNFQNSIYSLAHYPYVDVSLNLTPLSFYLYRPHSLIVYFPKHSIFG